MNRRAFLALSAAGVAGAAGAQPLPMIAAPPPSRGIFFEDWLAGFKARAVAAGLPRAVVERELAGVTPDPHVAALDARQPEFARPVSAYVEGAIGPERVAIGRAKRTAIPAFADIEKTYGVPRDILIAVWAMESGFGVHQGDLDVIRCLATLALGRRREWAEDQLTAALRMIANGDVTRSRLQGSWAGALGQTQILPTSYLADAVSVSSGQRPDVWGSAPDALATAANLLAKAGWRRGEGWALEVTLPAGFDYGLSEGPREEFAWWAARGARQASPAAWRSDDAHAPAVLLLPSGAGGPAFLALPNHFVIRSYNNSIAYALTIGLLADRFAGGSGLARPWPAESPLSLDQRLAAQSALGKLGYGPVTVDGMIGAGTRQALRAWQKAQGLPADGYLSPVMVQRLTAAAAARA
jgi:lytic murein transglycosylase